MRKLIVFVALATLAAAATPAAQGQDPIGPGDIGDVGGVDDTDGTSSSIDFAMDPRFASSPSLVVAPEDEPAPDPWDDPTWQEYLHPDGWGVQLFGTAPSGVGPIATWSWSISQVAGAWSEEGTGQTLRVLAPALGFYDVTLTLADANDVVVFVETKRIELDDLVIAVAGDSMASGEGNPDIPGTGELQGGILPVVAGGTVSRWVDPDCDRSANNFGAMAAEKLENDDPHTSITYINVACSGAQAPHLTDLMYSGVLGPGQDNGGQIPGRPAGRFHPPQLTQLAAALCGFEPTIDELYPELLPSTFRTWLQTDKSTLPPTAGLGADCTRPGARPVDELLLSIGINDVGFRDLILTCADLDDVGLTEAGIKNIVGWLHETGTLTPALLTTLLASAVFFPLIQGTIAATLTSLYAGIAGAVEGGCENDTGLVQQFEEGLGQLPIFLSRMQDQIEASGLVSGGVYHVQYPNAVITDNCDDDFNWLPSDEVSALSRLDEDEIRFLNDINDRVNQLIRSPQYFGTLAYNTWPTPVGVDDAWLGHGYCDADPWFVSLSESLEQYNNEVESDLRSPTGRLVGGVPEYETYEGDDPDGDGNEQLDISQFGILHPDEQGHAQLAAAFADEYAERNRPVTDVLEIELLSVDYVDDVQYISGVDDDPPGFIDFEIIVGRNGRYGGTVTEPPLWGQRALYQTQLRPILGGGGWTLDELNGEIALVPPEGRSDDIDPGDLIVKPPRLGPITVEINENDTLLVALSGALPQPQGDVECFGSAFDPRDDDLFRGPGSGIYPVAFALPIRPDPGTGTPCTTEIESPRRAAGLLVFFEDSDAGWGSLASGESRILEAPAAFLAPGGQVNGLGGFDLTFRVTRVGVNRPPVADAGGPYTVDEGSSVVLDGSGSSDPDGDTLAYSWSGAVSGDEVTATYEGVDDETVVATLTVTDPDAASDADTTTITVENVAPTLDAELSASAVAEGEAIDLTLSCTDPGSLDTHTLSIDWGAADLVAPTPSPPTEITCDGTSYGPFTQGYGDNGAFDVTVTVTDDDGGTDTATFGVDVANTAPAVTTSADLTDLPGGPAVLVRPFESTTVDAGLSDDGSDDLTATWSTGTSETFFADGNDPDAAVSPGLPFPVAATTSETFAADGPAVIDGSLRVDDDDGGTATDGVDILITGDLDHQFGFGAWRNELSDPRRLTAEDVTGLLDVVARASSVFGDEAVAIPTAAEAVAVLDADASDRDGLARELLRAWLDVASGAVQWTETLPGRGSVIGELIADAEAVYLDPGASATEIRSASASLRPI